MTVSIERELQLQQALLAILAAIGHKGYGIDEACAMAVGGLMSDGYWQRAEPQYREGAADEIDKANTRLNGQASSFGFES